MKSGKIVLQIIICLVFFQVFSVFGQEKLEEITSWEDNLFAKNVLYEDFACQTEDKETVAKFFQTHPLNRKLQVCHNNCAVLETFSSRSLPPLSDKVKGDGIVAIHILANVEGRPIFARAVNGNFIIRKLAEIRACESKFRTYNEMRQNVLFYCPTEKCILPQPVEKK